MASAPETIVEAGPTAQGRGGSGVGRRPLGLSWGGLGLAAVVLLAAAFRLWDIGAIGEANPYYTAAVKSMLQSWQNFFFVAAEPGGSVSVDKPPLGLWLQAASAAALGVSGVSVVLPQLLAGLASVVLLYHLVRRSFGVAAGLLAALALALTPVAVAVERNNTPDATLILTLLLAAWAFLKATETGRLGLLLLGAALVGVGFNVKMMQAFLPLPAFYALYLLCAQKRLLRRLADLALATLVLLPIALSWAIAVDLTPADRRPYVGSSGTNSALNLAVGYNGMQRLLDGGPGGAVRIFGSVAGQQPPRQPPPGPVGQPGPGPPGGPGGMFSTGEAGALRLFQPGLASQVSWLLPFGLVSIVAAAAGSSWRRMDTPLQRGLILWGGWLLTGAAFFSAAGFFHQYYLAMLAPPLAALCALGVAYLRQLWAKHPWRAAAIALGGAAATLAFQLYAATLYGALSWWAALPVAIGAAGAGLLVLGLRSSVRTLSAAAAALLAAALLVLPAVWSGLTAATADPRLPQAYAGETSGPRAPQPGASGRIGSAQELASYLEPRTQGVEYMLVVPSSPIGAELVLATGRPVLYAGGFNGSDQVIDGAGLAQLVARGAARYVLWGVGGPDGGRGVSPSIASIASYLQRSCAVVTGVRLQGGTLYRCVG